MVEDIFQELQVATIEKVLRKNSVEPAEEELRHIEARDGKITAEAVVEFAKDENTALHSHFEWDDTEAAHQYRLSQARNFIATRVTIIPRKDSEIVTRAYVHIQDRDGDGYVSLNTVLSDEEKTKQMLSMAYRDVRIFQKKYSALSEIAELKGLFKAIDEITKSD